MVMSARLGLLLIIQFTNSLHTAIWTVKSSILSAQVEVEKYNVRHKKKKILVPDGKSMRLPSSTKKHEKKLAKAN